MREIGPITPMAPNAPDILARALSPVTWLVMDLGLMDKRFEANVAGGGKCFWLTDGRRVEMYLVTGAGLLCSVSKEPDPLYPALAAKGGGDGQP